MADVVGDVAPHVPVRDLDTLRRHFDGLDGDELADRLVRNAARATAGIGAAGGGVASLSGRPRPPCCPPRSCWPPRRWPSSPSSSS